VPLPSAAGRQPLVAGVAGQAARDAAHMLALEAAHFKFQVRRHAQFVANAGDAARPSMKCYSWLAAWDRMTFEERAHNGVVDFRIVEIGQVPCGLDHGALGVG